MRAASARARANIALAKYWGKRDDARNLPAVPSVSITLDPLVTETTVVFDEALAEDRFELDGAPAEAGELARVTRLLDEVRALSGVTARARVTSANDFPTAAGLASSASGFAALAGAASAAAGLDEPLEALSARARRASASAARSIWGGYVELPVSDDDALSARPIAGPEHWDLRVVVAVTAEGRKAIGSRRAMRESRASSVYWDAWVACAPALTAGVREALLARDAARLVPLVEQSFFAMHAVAMTASPLHPLLAAGQRGRARDRPPAPRRGRAGLPHHGRRPAREGPLPGRGRAARAGGPGRDRGGAPHARGAARTRNRDRDGPAVIRPVSAPGKLMISGEYVVLDGAEALVAAVDARAVARLSPPRSDRSPDGDPGSPHREGLPPEAVLARSYAEQELGPVPMELTIDTSALRAGDRKLGLGSSAAASAASAGAVLAYHGGDPARERPRILGWALAGHRAVAPQGSGADVAASTLGGVVRFQRDTPEAASVVAWPEGLEVVVVWTGEPARTSDLLARVRGLADADRARYDAASAALRDAARALPLGGHRRRRGGRRAGRRRARARHGAARRGGGGADRHRAVGGGGGARGALGRGGQALRRGGGDVALAFFADPDAAARFRAECSSHGLTPLPLVIGAEGVRIDAS
ncbi:MAG: diphosphomevalonate decarboxylase [Sandaracinaceae bacterium]|nr:diphosphomevalonate decarboxylase [Sandaracinaceae bacterium]